MQTRERQALLENFAYQAWLERGQPFGSPEIDWAMAERRLEVFVAEELRILEAELSSTASSNVEHEEKGSSIAKPSRQLRSAQNSDRQPNL